MEDPGLHCSALVSQSYNVVLYYNNNKLMCSLVMIQILHTRTISGAPMQMYSFNHQKKLMGQSVFDIENKHIPRLRTSSYENASIDNSEVPYSMKCYALNSDNGTFSSTSLSLTHWVRNKPNSLTYAQFPSLSKPKHLLRQESKRHELLVLLLEICSAWFWVDFRWHKNTIEQ